MRTLAIIQARCESTRLHNKVFALIDCKPLLWHVVNRLSYSKYIDKIIVATTTNKSDDKIEEWCKSQNVSFFRGSENDVLNRFYEASLAFPSDVIVRITADDPFKEPDVVDRVIKTLTDGNYDYVTNNYPASFPEGLDCEAFRSSVLSKMESESKDNFEREHVTQYIFHNLDKFKIANVQSNTQLSHLRWTIDSEADYEMVKAIYANREQGRNGILLMDEILSILEKHPDISLINSNVKRSAMYQNN